MIARKTLNDVICVPRHSRQTPRPLEVQHRREETIAIAGERSRACEHVPAARHVAGFQPLFRGVRLPNTIADLKHSLSEVHRHRCLETRKWGVNKASRL